MKVFWSPTTECELAKPMNGLWKVFSLAFLSAALACAGQGTAATNGASAAGKDGGLSHIRVGIARGSWLEFNRNDAAVAISVWARTILAQKGIPVEIKAILYESNAELIDDLKAGGVDCVNMPVDQFLLLPSEHQPTNVYLASSKGSYCERYVVIAHKDSDIHELRDLQGHKVLAQSGVRTSMAMTWLDAALASKSLQEPEEFMNVIQIEKPSKAILPVFFRQADACLVTSNAFEVASELNPQLKTNLRVVAASPEVVTSVFFFRQNSPSKAAQQLEPAVLTLHDTPAGLQILTVFQSERMIRTDVSCLESTRRLIAERDRLRRQASPDSPK